MAYLRSTLGVYLGKPRVDQILRGFGRRLGRSLSVLDPEAPDVTSMVCQLGAQVGLGRFTPIGEGEGGGLGEQSPWALSMERLAELADPGKGRAAAPEFTAGFLEGLFEGTLGARVQGELRALPGGRWQLQVDLMPVQGPSMPGTARFQLPAHRAYGVEARDGTDFFEQIAPYVLPGRTLGFTRELPRRLRTEFGFNDVEMHWFAVTERPGESILSPRQVGKMVGVVEEFLERRSPQAFVFVQGLDYLVRRNGGATVLRAVEIVKERVASAHGTLVIELPTETMSAETLGGLRRELLDQLPLHPD